jgi:acylphosphatase
MTGEDSRKTTRVHLSIRGRVQGVYYRASMVREAQEFGLTGWVRNCEDGSVEAIAEGEQNLVELLIAWCRQGPSGARIDGVEVRWESPEHRFSGFVVKR